MTPYLIDNKLFDKFFAEECAPLKNNSVLPKSQTFLTPSRPCYLDLNKHDILKIMRALNINKAHGHDDIFNRIIEIKTKSLLKPINFFIWIFNQKNLVAQTHGKDPILYLCI